MSDDTSAATTLFRPADTASASGPSSPSEMPADLMAGTDRLRRVFDASQKPSASRRAGLVDVADAYRERQFHFELVAHQLRPSGS